MGSPKALLALDGRTFIERIVSALRSTKVGKIVVVLGHHAVEIRPAIEHLPVSVVINEQYRKGQLSSLLAAIRTLEGTEEVDGILVHLVDHPFLNPGLVNEMIDKFYQSKKLVVLPRYRDRRGHPVIFSRKLFPELLSAPLDQGAKSVVHAHRDETLEIEVEDESVLIDVDTREQYREQVEKRS
jgi:molybdenum cofactor cytidylyltransferase